MNQVEDMAYKLKQKIQDINAEFQRQQNEKQAKQKMRDDVRSLL